MLLGISGHCIAGQFMLKANPDSKQESGNGHMGKSVSEVFLIFVVGEYAINSAKTKG